MENKEKIKQINRKLSEVEASAGRRDQINRELKRAVSTPIIQMTQENSEKFRKPSKKFQSRLKIGLVMVRSYHTSIYTMRRVAD